MPILILYATNHGASAVSAEYLLKKIDDAEMFNIKDNLSPDLQRYSTVILGGSIHMGRIQKNMRKFIENNHDTLLTKRLGLYLCCMYEGEIAEKQFVEAYPKTLRDAAKAKGLFGGGFDFAKMNLLERSIVKSVAGVTKSESKMNYSEMDRFAKAMAEAK